MKSVANTKKKSRNPSAKLVSHCSVDLPVDTLQINEEVVKDSYYETNPNNKKDEISKIRVYRERKDIGAATKSK